MNYKFETHDVSENAFANTANYTDCWHRQRYTWRGGVHMSATCVEPDIGLGRTVRHRPQRAGRRGPTRVHGESEQI